VQLLNVKLLVHDVTSRL